MTTPIRSGTIAFRPRARLLKLIGEELISDEVVAVAELVKNAHDADARTVTVSFCGVTTPEGRIEVRDDGDGMDLETLLGRWMEPAASTKIEVGRRVTPRGRRVLGEKGVGRFAADKIAGRLELITRRPGTAGEVRAHIDWDSYNRDDALLSEIHNRWEVARTSQIEPGGTVLRMCCLRAAWTERMFRRLAIRLGRLLSPFRDGDPFSIVIESDEFPQYAGELRLDLLDRAPYRVEARFDGHQTIRLCVNGRQESEHRWNGQGELACGPVRLRLHAFDLEAEALARLGPRMEVRAWLKEWTGVSIYRDGFRVWPYGEPHDDWLRLDQRRVNNPVERLSNNQVIGFIDIGRDRNPELLDQTNREGLIHNRAFDDLRRLAYYVFQAIESERQSVRHPIKRAATTSRATRVEECSIAQDLAELADRADHRTALELRQLSRRLEEHLDRRDEAHRQMVAGLSGLAAAGVSAGSLLPLLLEQLGEVRSGLGDLQEMLAGRRDPSLRGAVEGLAGSLASLLEQFRILQTAAEGGDRRRAIDVVAEIEAFQESVLPLLVEQDVQLVLDSPDKEVLRTEMRPENFHCLLQILLANALDWLPRNDTRRIRIAANGQDGFCEIIFSDSGPGVPADLSSRIFEPLFSRKEEGRGMGLTVARQLVQAHGGDIHLIIDGRRRGANFRITLPRKRSRATFGGNGGGPS